MTALSLHCPICNVTATSRSNFLDHLHGKKHEKFERLGPQRHDLHCHVCRMSFPFAPMLEDHIHGGFSAGPGSVRNTKYTAHRLQAALLIGVYLPYCYLCLKPVVLTFGEQHDLSVGHTSRMAVQGLVDPLCDGQPWVRWTYCTRPPTALQSAQIFRDEMQDTIRVIAMAQRMHGIEYDIQEVDGLSLVHAFNEQLWMFVCD